ncbi:MAG: sigma-70 family RNA polymerase sigma factor [Solirubrobacterales bacterium]|nr:sigma-70 family RNA polymerase sigma factor [Solirubrobacterales bacterium]
MEVSALKYSGGIGLHGRSRLLRLQSDERLIAFVRRGNPAAFEALVGRYESRLQAFCRHLLGSREDAEDVLQEVLAAAFNAILADERPINVRPWLYRIARNRSLNHLRRMQAVGVDSMDLHYSDNGASTADKVHEREEFRLLVGDIHELPETQKTALVLREMDALSYEQIAEAMETTVPSVKSLLVRARVSLAEAAEARLLSCEEVRLELGEIAEGLRRRPTPLVRRHLRACKRCGEFRVQLKQTNRALAALLPVGPLAFVHKLAFTHLGHSAGASAGSGATAVGSGATAMGSGATAVSSGATAMGSGAAGSTAAGGSALAGSAAGSALATGSTASSLVSAGIGTIATKAAAGLAAAALVTAGAVEVGHVSRRHGRSLAAVSQPEAAQAQQAVTSSSSLRAVGSRAALRSKARRHSKPPVAKHPVAVPAAATAPPAKALLRASVKPAKQPPGRTQTQSDTTVLSQPQATVPAPVTTTPTTAPTPAAPPASGAASAGSGSTDGGTSGSTPPPGATSSADPGTPDSTSSSSADSRGSATSPPDSTTTTGSSSSAATTPYSGE